MDVLELEIERTKFSGNYTQIVCKFLYISKLLKFIKTILINEILMINPIEYVEHSSHEPRR